MIREPLFDALISGPLAKVIGKPLLAVHYWVLNCDFPTFDTSFPNDSGIAKIDLEFQTTTLEVTWDWKKRFRTGGNAYHIQVSEMRYQGGEPMSSQTWNISGLRRVIGSEVQPWAGAIGSPLIDVEVYGFDGSPQAIWFVFFQSGIVVTAGYSGETEEDLMIGDGDDLLVFRDSEWQDQRKHGNWTLLWTASSGADLSLLSKL